MATQTQAEKQQAARAAEARRQRRVQSSLANPALFGELYVRPFDEGWSAPLPDFARQMLAFVLGLRPSAGGPGAGVVILPPEFLKTTLLSQVLPLWLTTRASAFGELLRGMLLSEEEGMAARNLGVLRWHVENNDKLAADFIDADGEPLLRPDDEEQIWRADAIVVARHGTSKDPTWQAKGLDSKGIQGRRLDWVIGDDIITPKNAFSPAYRAQAERLWDLEVTTRVVEDGVALACGNFNDHRDLLSTLASRPSYRVFRRPALAKADNPAEADPAGVPLWPENWSLERLRREERKKPNRFRRIFLLDARAERGERLSADWVRLITEPDVPVAEARFYISLDPAAGGDTSDLDYFVISVGALHTTHLDLVESIAFRRSIPQQMALVRATHDRYDRVGLGVRKIFGAKQAMDRYMRGALVIAAPQLAPKIQEVPIPHSKEERLEGLGAYAQSGWLRIVEGVWVGQTSDLADRHQELSLAEEWTGFPHARHDDRLDAIDVLIRGVREYDHGTVKEVEVTVQ